MRSFGFYDVTANWRRQAAIQSLALLRSGVCERSSVAVNRSIGETTDVVTVPCAVAGMFYLSGPADEIAPQDIDDPNHDAVDEAAEGEDVDVEAVDADEDLPDLMAPDNSPVPSSNSSGGRGSAVSLIVNAPTPLDPFCLHILDPFQPEVGWNTFSTLRVSKKCPQFSPVPNNWLLNGPSVPMRKSITFLSHMDNVSVVVYLGKKMSQEVRLEKGSNVFTWVEPNMRLCLGAHTVPQGWFSEGYLSFGVAGETYWRTLPFGICDRPHGSFGQLGYLDRDFAYPDEDWDPVRPPSKLVAIIPTDQEVDIRNYTRTVRSVDMVIGSMMLPAVFPLRYDYLACSYYELISYPRFCHPVDQNSMIVLPKLERTFLS